MRGGPGTGSAGNSSRDASGRIAWTRSSACYSTTTGCPASCSPLAGGAPKKHRVNNAVRVCKAVNTLNPAIPATIAIKYSPWHEVWPAHLPPTDFGPYHDAALSQFQEYMLQFRQWLDEAYVEFDA